MKNRLALFFVFSLSILNYAQKQMDSKDSIKVFYGELFSILKKGYLHKNSVDWKSVEAETTQNLTQYHNFKKSLSEIKPLFDKINANHCSLFYQNTKYSGTGKVIPKDAVSKDWRKKYAAKPTFETTMLNDKYAYILMPEMIFMDTRAKNISKIAQPMYDQIAALKTKYSPEGWIIDLRFNPGGNSMPMLLALYDLLGDNDIWGTLDLNKKQKTLIKLNKGKYLDGSTSGPSINPNGELLDEAKVAVITGIYTASSGEVVALAFKERPHTIFIGEKSYGATTTNIQVDLPFNTTMALTIGYDSDRNGVFHEQIVPDIVVSNQDNFEDPMKDGNVVEAVKFFEGV